MVSKIIQEGEVDKAQSKQQVQHIGMGQMV